LGGQQIDCFTTTQPANSGQTRITMTFQVPGMCFENPEATSRIVTQLQGYAGASVLYVTELTQSGTMYAVPYGEPGGLPRAVPEECDPPPSGAADAVYRGLGNVVKGQEGRIITRDEVEAVWAEFRAEGRFNRSELQKGKQTLDQEVRERKPQDTRSAIAEGAAKQALNRGPTISQAVRSPPPSQNGNSGRTRAASPPKPSWLRFRVEEFEEEWDRLHMYASSKMVNEVPITGLSAAPGLGTVTMDAPVEWSMYGDHAAQGKCVIGRNGCPGTFGKGQEPRFVFHPQRNRCFWRCYSGAVHQSEEEEIPAQVRRDVDVIMNSIGLSIDWSNDPIVDVEK
jgi:hypothetical protein